ncbi:hypothetical protein G3578_14245 [Brevibacillus sp. SYP-B805]|uniref:TolB family protein n=1 Tax=Brevibacillus sp. SYP-B805 TaxID=1578199 RepID=UPI0013ED166D|nr:PD40 domain-containing protein [Brevibacillus sp. SYP-B805]NGQ96322.1 hypothetical protein [Brevibacillus sp. SYP-B805]
MRDDERMSTEELHDSTITDLLRHLQQLRRAVPVNYQLKAELREKLLERMREMELQHSPQPPDRDVGRRWSVWGIYGGAVVLILAAVLLLVTRDAIVVREEELAGLRMAQSAEQVALAPDGEHIAYVANGDRLYTRPLSEDQQESRFILPATTGRYRAVAWSHSGRQLAVVEENQQVNRIWLVETDPDGAVRASSRLLKEEKGAVYHTPSWSPDNLSIAYTRMTGGKEEIWVSSTLSLQEKRVTEGSQPDWSPDGGSIAFVKGGTVSVLNLRTGEVRTIGPGTWPAWIAPDQIAYTTPQGNLVVARLEEKSVESDMLPVPAAMKDRIVRADWSRDRKEILISYQAGQSLAFGFAVRR